MKVGGPLGSLGSGGIRKKWRSSEALVPTYRLPSRGALVSQEELHPGLVAFKMRIP